MGIVPWHQVITLDTLAKFIEPLVESPPCFTDIHQDIFSGRPDPVETGIFGDLPEFVFVCSERDPRSPVEVAPARAEKVHMPSQD
jgi:hypothetical protein